MSELDKSQSRATEILVSFMYQDPEKARLAILITENIGMPNDQITFAWINDTQQLVQFLEICIPYLYANCQSNTEIPEEVYEISKAVQKSQLVNLDREQIDQLNSIMNLSSIVWTGTFEDICLAKGDIETSIIKLFRDGVDSEAPISELEKASFKDFLLDEIYH